ncbi:porin [Otariodibacter oris]|uniref:Putative porin n=1 Tax=Otariodibacter oris TaxID=1032623 RepID=A0A420XIA0_9PAST|nr:porin [Otariodibacter oris]QGM80748.1 hypothetical protein A6A10_04675 [Otariodibacter oris]RKR77087.1 putative porin [Otariodibacter oris]
MKKTLVALAVTAFATSASALTIYEADGTKVDFGGSIRMRLDNHREYTKVGGVKQDEKRAHTNLHNDGSRFELKMRHDINDDFYGFGRLEFRFNGGNRASGTDQFGDLYTNRAYVGLGSKTYGEVTFGRQVTIGDDIHQAGYDNAYGVFDTALTDSGRSVIRYDYKGIEGLQVGFDYRFAEERGKDGEVVDPTADKEYVLKSGYGAGIIYSFDVADGQAATLAAGYTRDNYKSDVVGPYAYKKHTRDAWGASAKYEINDFEFALDYTGQFGKKGSEKNVVNGFRVGGLYNVLPNVAVYGNYGLLYNEVKDSGDSVKERSQRHRFMLGTSYKPHKQIMTYVEAGYSTAKITKGQVEEKPRETNFGIGLRVFW